MQRKNSNAKTGRTVIKTVLPAPSAPIYAWAVQQISTGNRTAGFAAVGIATVMLLVYILMQEYDLPYEEEIIDVIDQSGIGQEDVEQAAQNAAERAAERINEETSTTNQTETETSQNGSQDR